LIKKNVVGTNKIRYGLCSKLIAAHHMVGNLTFP